MLINFDTSNLQALSFKYKHSFFFSCVGLAAIFWGLSENQIETSTVLFLTGSLICIVYLLIRIPHLLHEQETGLYSKWKMLTFLFTKFFL